MPTTIEKDKAVSVGSFAIEADHPRNADLIIQVIIGGRLRSRIKATKDVFTRRKGEQIVRSTSAKMFENLPANIPGMQLHVNPANNKWRIIDPLCDDEELLEEIREAIQQSSGMAVSSKLHGVPTKSGRLDANQMKTLVREMFDLLQAGHVRTVKGKEPVMEDIDKLPGDYLLNSRNPTDWTQPKLEKDLPKWVDRLNRMGD